MKVFLKYSILTLLICFIFIYFFENISLGAESQDSFFNKIDTMFKTKTTEWGKQLIPVTGRIFYLFLIIDIILFGFSGGIGMATGNKNIASVMGEFVLMVILPASFIFIVLHNYQDWSNVIIGGLIKQAQELENVPSGDFFAVGYSLFSNIWSQIGLSPSSWLLALVGLIIYFIFILISLQILLIQCESYIVLNAGIIMLGFGAFAQTRQYAINFIRYTLSVAIKLFVMQLMVGISFSFIKDFINTPVKFQEYSIILGVSIVMLGLIRVIPDICSGIIQGQHVGTGNALSGAIGSVSAGAMGALAVSKQIGSNIGGAANTASALSDTMKDASKAGLSGARKAGFVAKSVAGAMGGEASRNSALGSFASRLKR